MRRTKKVGSGRCRSCREIRNRDDQYLLCSVCLRTLQFDQWGRPRPEEQQKEWLRGLEGAPGSRKARQGPKQKASRRPPKWGQPDRHRKASLEYAYGDRR